MAFVDDIIDTLATALAGVLAPYQPDLPPLYPNRTNVLTTEAGGVIDTESGSLLLSETGGVSPTAGQIPSTLIAPGHPIQYPVTTRLENKQATVVIYDGKIEKDGGTINEQIDHLPIINGQSQIEVSRSEVEVIIEIWSYDQPSRRAVTNLIRQFVGDYVRLTENDGTTTLHRYVRTIKTDTDQVDSVYINQIYLMSDYTVTKLQPSYVVTQTHSSTGIEDANDDILGTITL